MTEDRDGAIERANGILTRCEAVKARIDAGLEDGTCPPLVAAEAIEKVYTAEGQARAALILVTGASGQQRPKSLGFMAWETGA